MPARQAATLSGPVTVDSGAVLRGHGTIIGNVTNSGTVFPGGTVGILTVNGNYVQNPGSTLNIEVTPNDSTPGVGYDQLNVTGTATLAGNLAVQVDPGTYTVGEHYDIVHAAGGVSGTFAGETYNPLFANYLTPKITYGANDTYLNLDATPGAQGSPGLAYTSGASAVNNAYILNQSLLGAFSRIFSWGFGGELRRGAGRWCRHQSPSGPGGRLLGYGYPDGEQLPTGQWPLLDPGYRLSVLQ
ncbi:MAG: autotransporter outer membrane beta-barrel domain-containing protein [Acidithiobacillus sp.]